MSRSNIVTFCQGVCSSFKIRFHQSHMKTQIKLFELSEAEELPLPQRYDCEHSNFIILQNTLAHLFSFTINELRLATVKNYFELFSYCFENQNISWTRFYKLVIIRIIQIYYIIILLIETKIKPKIGKFAKSLKDLNMVNYILETRVEEHRFYFLNRKFFTAKRNKLNKLNWKFIHIYQKKTRFTGDLLWFLLHINVL